VYMIEEDMGFFVMESTNQRQPIKWDILLAYLGILGFCLGAWAMTVMLIEKCLG